MSIGRKTKLRRILLLLPIIILTGLSNGFTQEWMPIKPGEKYNYLYNSGIIHTTVWVDSVDYNNGDSVYYLNRIAKKMNDYTLIKNRPVFLQREMHFSDQKLVMFSPEEYVIPLEMNQGESWIFDTINNLTATLVSVFEDTVFGQNDSIREIIIEDGQANQHTMRISKNHGVLRFPDFAFPDSAYILAGLENAGLGQQMPMTREFFDMHIGDEYQYYSNDSYMHQYGSDSRYTRRRYKVISISDTSEQLQYVIRGVYRSDYYGAYGGHSVSYGIIEQTTTHTAFGLTNLYPNQLIGSGPTYDHMSYTFDEDYQAPAKSDDIYYYYGEGDTLTIYPTDGQYNKYILGIGLVKMNGFNETNWHSYSASLEAYQKDGIVHGSFADYCYLLDPAIRQEMRIMTIDTTITTLDTLIIRASPGFDSYEWINTGTLGEQDTIIASEYGTGNFKFGVDITYMNCLQSDTFQLNIIEPVPLPGFSYENEEQTFYFTNESTYPDFIESYTWDFGDGNSSDEKDPEHTFLETGYFDVCLTITDINGNPSTYCKEIKALTSIFGHDPTTGIAINLLPSGMLQIKNAGAKQQSIQLEIINQAGQPVYGQEQLVLNPGEKAMISLASLPHGFYIARVVTDQSVFTKKISR